MTKANVHKIRKIYTICMAAYSCVVGILFIWQVWSIFRSAPNNPYTVASITAAFSKIAVFVWIWVAALVVGLFIPVKSAEKVKGGVPSKVQIERLKKRIVLDEEEQCAMQSMERFRFAMACAIFVVWAAVLIVGICYLADSFYTPRFDKKFFQEHNALVDRIVCFSPWVIGGILVSIVCAIKIEKSRVLQIALLKNILAKKAKIEGACTSSTGIIGRTKTASVICEKLSCLKKPKAVTITRIALGVIGVVFVVFGIFNGGMNDVLEKAVKICTQCIGLG